MSTHPDKPRGDDPGESSPADDAALDAAASLWTPAYSAGWDARQAGAARDAAAGADWLRGWDECDADHA